MFPQPLSLLRPLSITFAQVLEQFRPGAKGRHLEPRQRARQIHQPGDGGCLQNAQRSRRRQCLPLGFRTPVGVVDQQQGRLERPGEGVSKVSAMM